MRACVCACVRACACVCVSVYMPSHLPFLILCVPTPILLCSIFSSRSLTGTNELDDDDRLVVASLKGGAFKFLKECYVNSTHFQQEVCSQQCPVSAMCVHIHGRC